METAGTGGRLPGQGERSAVPGSGKVWLLCGLQASSVTRAQGLGRKTPPTPLTKQLNDEAETRTSNVSVLQLYQRRRGAEGNVTLAQLQLGASASFPPPHPVPQRTYSAPCVQNRAISPLGLGRERGWGQLCSRSCLDGNKPFLSLAL